MTARVVYIGDKLMATGFRLSGAQVFTPKAQADSVWSSFQLASENADLIMISQSHAGLIAARLNRYQRRTPVPPVLCLPEAGEYTTPARATIAAAKISLGLS
jgi:vacuolar-type H+-ATPase subunit F/Vma7